MKFLHTNAPPLLHKDLRSPNVCIIGGLRDGKRGGKKRGESGGGEGEEIEVKVKIMDFGLSDYGVVRGRSVMATWQWLAPELLKDWGGGWGVGGGGGVVEGPVFDLECDVYSFGIVLNEIASRKCPFIDDYWEKNCTPDGLRWRSPFACREEIVNQVRGGGGFFFLFFCFFCFFFVLFLFCFCFFCFFCFVFCFFFCFLFFVFCFLFCCKLSNFLFLLNSRDYDLLSLKTLPLLTKNSLKCVGIVTP